MKKGYCIKMDSIGLKVMKGSMVCMKAHMNSSQLYILKGKTITCEANVVSQGQSTTSSARLWHWRLGHISMKGLEMLEKQDMLMGDHMESFGFCEDCVLGKAHKV